MNLDNVTYKQKAEDSQVHGEAKNVRIKQYNTKKLLSLKIKLNENQWNVGSEKLERRVEGSLPTRAQIHRGEKGRCPTIIKLKEHQHTC